MQIYKEVQEGGTLSHILIIETLSISSQMQQLFYENYEQNKKGYIRDLHNSKIHRHHSAPNKTRPYQYRATATCSAAKSLELRHRTIQLHHEIVLMSKYSNNVRSIKKTSSWESLLPS